MGYCSLRVVTPPLVEPVSVAEAALHLRTDSDDPVLPGHITAARIWAEAYLNRSLITRTLRYTIAPSLPPPTTLGAPINPIVFVMPLTWWPAIGAPFELPMAPAQAITNVTQRSRDGVVRTLDPTTDFFADLGCDPASLTLRSIGQPLGSDLSVTYKAGFGDTADAVPATAKHAIKLLTAFFYERRGDDDGADPPSAVRLLLNADRLVTFA